MARHRVVADNHIGDWGTQFGMLLLGWKTKLDEAALALYAQDNMARYKQPRLFIHLPELPMGANGKLLRRSLRAAYEAQR